MREKIGDVFTIIRNGVSIKQGDNDTGFPITRIETISDWYVDRNKFGYAGITDLSRYEDYLLNNGDILMSHINSEKHLGKVALYKQLNDEKIIHGMNLLMLRADKAKLLPAYANFYFRSDAFRTQIPRITKKSVNQASFTVTALKELSILIPTLREQESIAFILQRINDLIALRKQQLAKLDELVKSRFIEMFGTVANNRNNFPVKRLGTCAKVQGGYAFKSNDFVKNGIKLVQIGNVNKNNLDWHIINNVPYSFLAKYKDFALKKDDIVIAMTRPIIKSLNSVKIAFVSDKDLPCLLNQRVGRFIINNNLINSLYLSELCKLDDFRLHVEKMSGNSLQPNISSYQIEDYKILIPSINSQNHFACFVQQINKSKSAVQESLEKLELMQKSLMQEYFG